MVTTEFVHEGTKYRYRVEGDAAHIVRCSGQSNLIRIPETLGGYAVTSLGDASFSQLTRAKRIICPRGLKRIGRRTFEGCMHLSDIEFNEGLTSIGDEAFFLCSALRSLEMPNSLENVGVNLTGARGNKWAGSVNVRFAPTSAHLFIDEKNVIYRRVAGGLVLVDATKFHGDELVVDPRTVEIGPRAIAQHGTVVRVVLPEGLLEIGEEAFRGCTKLEEVVIPETLRAIDFAAFSCTNVKSLYVPAQCTTLAPHALMTGPVLEGEDARAFSSGLAEYRVHGDNPSYCMEGPVLCRRIARSDALEAIACPSVVQDVRLTRTVRRVGEGTFAGTSKIGTLRIHDEIKIDGIYGLLPHHACERIVIDFAEPKDGFGCVSAAIPSGNIGIELLKQSLSGSAVDVAGFLRRYDEALPQVEDRLEQAKLVIERLSAPVMLDDESRHLFEDIVEAGFESICAHFGVRNYRIGFDQMMDAGIIDEARVSDVIALLSKLGDTPTVAYLLECKRARFGKALWDYDI